MKDKMVNKTQLRRGQRQCRRQQQPASFQITNPIPSRLLSCCGPPSERSSSQTQIPLPITTRILPSRLLLCKKTEIADQLVLNCVDSDEGVDIDSRSLIEGFRPGQYICIQLTDAPCETIDLLYHIFVHQVSYLLKNDSDLSKSI